MSDVRQERESSGFNWRIQPVLILVMSLLVVFAISSLTAIEVVREQVRYRQELEQRGVLLAEVLEQILADALYFDNVEQARHFAEIARAMPEVHGYRVFNTQGRILVDSETPKYSAGSVDKAILNAVLGAETVTVRKTREFQIVAPIAAGDEVLGGVAVSLDASTIAPHVRFMIGERLRYGAIVVLLGIIAAALLGRWLTAPIRDLIDAARRVASGDLRFSVASRRGDEIGDLSSAFEEMMRKLERRARDKAEEHTAELEKANEQLRQHAMEDALTGLPNRRLLLDRFTVARAKANRGQRRLALLFLDLDEFKEINDSLGHAAGDEVLLVLAGRLKKVVRQEDTLARFGGDEFIVLVSSLGDPGEVSVVADKILQVIGEPVEVGGHEFRLTASLGISLYPDHGDTAGELLRKADIAMYRAKEKGRNGAMLFSAEIEAPTRDGRGY